MPDKTYDRLKELEARAAGVARRAAHKASLRPHSAAHRSPMPTLAPEDVAGLLEGLLLNLITPNVRRHLSREEVEQRRADLLRALKNRK